MKQSVSITNTNRNGNRKDNTTKIKSSQTQSSKMKVNSINGHESHQEITNKGKCSPISNDNIDHLAQYNSSIHPSTSIPKYSNTNTNTITKTHVANHKEQIHGKQTSLLSMGFVKINHDHNEHNDNEDPNPNVNTLIKAQKKNADKVVTLPPPPPPPPLILSDFNPTTQDYPNNNTDDDDDDIILQDNDSKANTWKPIPSYQYIQ